MPLSEGAFLGPYQILGPLGEGGMARVYRAFQPSLRREVAIKVIDARLADFESFRARFRREAEVLARLEHPNILPVFDYGEAEGTAYIVYRYITGGELKSLLGHPLPPVDVVRLLRPVASALDFAHLRGIVHRDIKPGNILLTQDQTPIVADFGLARILEAGIGGTDISAVMTGTDVTLGTPAYMAPEQVLGEPVDGRADQYALGVVAYQMLTGAIPFSADTPMAVALKQVYEPPPLPTTRNPELSAAVEEVLLTALAKDRAGRYAGCGAFVDALGLAADAPRTASAAAPAETAGGGAAFVAPLRRTAGTTSASAQPPDPAPPFTAASPAAPGAAASPAAGIPAETGNLGRAEPMTARTGEIAAASRRAAPAGSARRRPLPLLAAAALLALLIGGGALVFLRRGGGSAGQGSNGGSAAVVGTQAADHAPGSTSGGSASGTIFDGRLASNWKDETQPSESSVQVQRVVQHNGHAAIKVDSRKPYADGPVIVSSGVRTNGFTHLRFFIKPLRPLTLSEGSVSGSIDDDRRETVVFTSHAAQRTDEPNGWIRLDFPLTWLRLDGGVLTHLVFSTSGRSDGDTFYLADLALVTLPAASVDPALAGTLRFSARNNGRPVPGVVMVLSTGARATTDATGDAVFSSVPRGPLDYRATFPDSFEGKPLTSGDEGNTTVKAGTTVTVPITVVKSDLQLVEPKDGATAPRSVTLRWQAYQEAAGYHVVVDPTGPGDRIENKTADTSYAPGQALKAGTEYAFWVEAVNAAGDTIARSETVTFHTP